MPNLGKFKALDLFGGILITKIAYCIQSKIYNITPDKSCQIKSAEFEALTELDFRIKFPAPEKFLRDIYREPPLE